MMLAEGGTVQDGLILFAGVLGLTFFSLVLLRRNRQRVADSGEKAREQFEHLRGHSELRGSMNDLVLQIEDVSRRVNAQLDTKFTKLETVIRDADERIARLEGLLGQSRGVQRQPQPAAGSAQMQPRKQRPRSDPRPAPKPPTPSSQPTRPSQGEPEAGSPQPAGASGPAGDSAAPASHGGADVPRVSPAPAVRPALPADERVHRIYELADSGMTAIKIAETVGVPLGEVELTLNLRRFR